MDLQMPADIRELFRENDHLVDARSLGKMRHVVETRAAKAGGIKPLELGIGDSQRNKADAFVSMPGRRRGIGGDRIVGTVAGWLNDHAMLYAEPLMQGEQHFFRGIGRGVVAPVRE